MTERITSKKPLNVKVSSLNAPVASLICRYFDGMRQRCTFYIVINAAVDYKMYVNHTNV